MGMVLCQVQKEEGFYRVAGREKINELEKDIPTAWIPR